jgi:endo-1,4-beta-D-glucanase Y
MKKIPVLFLALQYCLISLLTAAEPNYPFPTHNTYFPGVIKPNHVDQETMDHRIRALYDEWKGAYLFNPPDIHDQLYVSYNQDHTSEPDNAVSVSEGHGYGMLLSVFMAGHDPQAQDNFDKLFRYYQAYPSVITAPLMGWQQVLVEGEIVPEPEGGDDSATDGDLDIAFALLLANKQWGSNGAIDYLTHARIIVTAILAGDINEEVNVLKLGDWVENDDEDYGKATRPSDFMLNHLRNFSASSGDPSWHLVIDKTYAIINELFANFSPQTGLLPDFSEFIDGQYVPAGPDFLERGADSFYSWNACRTPWRISTDYIFSGDPRALNQLSTLNQWIRSKTSDTPSQIKSGYKLDGVPLVSYTNLAFSTPFAVSAMIDASNQQWLNDLWDFTSSRPSSAVNYFDNSIRLLSLLIVSGNWWTPINLPTE